MDVKITFLNGNLEEEVYMTQSEKFISSGRANQVCKLMRFIYGLKQASKSWNILFDMTVKVFDFIKIRINHMYIRRQVRVQSSS